MTFEWHRTSDGDWGKRHPITFATLEEFVTWCSKQTDEVIVKLQPDKTIHLEIYDDWRE